MRGSRKKGARKTGGRPIASSRPANTPSERQEAADRAQTLRRGAEELLPSARLAKSWGVSVEEVRKAIAEIDLQPDRVVDGCAYYAPATARRIKEYLRR